MRPSQQNRGRCFPRLLDLQRTLPCRRFDSNPPTHRPSRRLCGKVPTVLAIGPVGVGGHAGKGCLGCTNCANAKQCVISPTKSTHKSLAPTWQFTQCTGGAVPSEWPIVGSNRPKAKSTIGSARAHSSHQLRPSGSLEPVNSTKTMCEAGARPGMDWARRRSSNWRSNCFKSSKPLTECRVRGILTGTAGIEEIQTTGIGQKLRKKLSCFLEDRLSGLSGVCARMGGELIGGNKSGKWQDWIGIELA